MMMNKASSEIGTTITFSQIYDSFFSLENKIIFLVYFS